MENIKPQEEEEEEPICAQVEDAPAPARSDAHPPVHRFVHFVTETKKPVDSVSGRNTTLITGVQVMWGVSIHASTATAKENPECM